MTCPVQDADADESGLRLSANQQRTESSDFMRLIVAVERIAASLEDLTAIAAETAITMDDKGDDDLVPQTLS